MLHTQKKRARGLARELIDWLTRRSIDPKLPQADADAVNAKSFGRDRANFPKGLDLLVVLGGDGTFLRSARELQGRDVPIIGVNLGRLGFLSQIEAAELFPFLEQAIDGRIESEKRQMIACDLIAGENRVEAIRALNEIVLTRKSRRTLSQFDISLNSHPFTKYAADGLIFSTPTGSTAYSLSAGGPIVSPAAAVFLMNPIYPHSFFDRTIVFGEDETVEAMPSGRHDMSVSADGLLTEVPDSVDFARISCGGHLRLVRAGKEDFYSILVKKLGI